MKLSDVVVKYSNLNHNERIKFKESLDLSYIDLFFNLENIEDTFINTKAIKDSNIYKKCSGDRLNGMVYSEKFKDYLEIHNYLFEKFIIVDKKGCLLRLNKELYDKKITKASLYLFIISKFEPNGLETRIDCEFKDEIVLMFIDLFFIPNDLYLSYSKDVNKFKINYLYVQIFLSDNYQNFINNFKIFFKILDNSYYNLLKEYSYNFLNKFNNLETIKYLHNLVFEINNERAYRSNKVFENKVLGIDIMMLDYSFFLVGEFSNFKFGNLNISNNKITETLENFIAELRIKLKYILYDNIKNSYIENPYHLEKSLSNLNKEIINEIYNKSKNSRNKYPSKKYIKNNLEKFPQYYTHDLTFLDMDSEIMTTSEQLRYVPKNLNFLIFVGNIQVYLYKFFKNKSKVGYNKLLITNIKKIYDDDANDIYLFEKYLNNLEKYMSNSLYDYYDIVDYFSRFYEDMLKRILIKSNKYSKKDIEINTLSTHINCLYDSEKDTNCRIFLKSILTNDSDIQLNLRNSFGHLTKDTFYLKHKVFADILIFLILYTSNKNIEQWV